MGLHTGHRRSGRTGDKDQIASHWSYAGERCGRDIEATRAATSAYDGVGYKGGKRTVVQILMIC